MKKIILTLAVIGSFAIGTAVAQTTKDTTAKPKHKTKNTRTTVPATPS
jgi:hypothetical protein